MYLNFSDIVVISTRGCVFKRWFQDVVFVNFLLTSFKYSFVVLCLFGVVFICLIIHLKYF